MQKISISLQKYCACRWQMWFSMSPGCLKTEGCGWARHGPYYWLGTWLPDLEIGKNQGFGFAWANCASVLLGSIVNLVLDLRLGWLTIAGDERMGLMSRWSTSATVHPGCRCFIIFGFRVVSFLLLMQDILQIWTLTSMMIATCQIWSQFRHRYWRRLFW